jgi:hypothetical protein
MKSPHSVYSILKFVEYQITKFKDSPHYLPGKLWQFIAAKNLWRKHNKILSNLDYGNIHHLSNNFLDRHNIDLGLDSKEPSIEARRIRTTWATKRREQGLSTEAMMGLMGHVDIDTTAKHYDNDNGSNNLKNQQLRGLQNRHLDDFQNYHVRLAQATTLSELREAIANAGSKSIAYEAVASKLGMKNSLDVVHLLSPAGQTYIAACTNSFEPSWKDARNHISNGEQCRFFNRCCMCDKAVIFKESLPWIARRINDLEALRLKIPAPEWALNYGTELSGWEWVMTSWNNPDDVAEAKVLSTLNKFSLPLTMVAKPEKPSPVDVLWEKL